VSLKADEDAGGLAVTGDDDLLGFGHAEDAGEVVHCGCVMAILTSELSHSV
jgi:hypothetical protein